MAVNGVGIYSRADSIGTAECYTKQDASQYDLSAWLFSEDTLGLVPGEAHTACSMDNTDDGVLYCGDEVPAVAGLMDRCAGYSDKAGTYKYHIAPVCLIDQLTHLRADSEAAAFAADPEGEFTKMTVGDVSAGGEVGWALDGFPIYGPIGTHGIRMLRCGVEGAHATVCLDSCNGFKGSIDEDHFMYRYYLAGDPDADAAVCSTSTENAHIDSPCCLKKAPPSTQTPYTIGCFAGCKFGETGCNRSGERGTTSSYEPHNGTIPSTSSYNSVVLKQAYIRPQSLIQVPFGDYPLALVDTPDSQVVNVTSITYAATATAPNKVTTVSGTGDANHNKNSLVTMDVLPSGFGDTVIEGLSADAFSQSGMLYYTSRSGVYALHEHSTEKTLMIAGLTYVAITGFNFGSSKQDLRSISVGGNLCDSPVWLSSTQLSCVLSEPGATNKGTLPKGETNNKNGDGSDSSRWYSSEDVTISLAGGQTAGIHPDPLLVKRSNSGRPVITDTSFEYRPFHPRSIATVHRPTGSDEVVSSTAQFSVEEKTTKTESFFCDSFSVSDTDYSRRNYKLCEISACDGDVISASTCSVGGECSGDTYFALHSEHYPVEIDGGGAYICDSLHTCPPYTYNSSEVTFNNDLCGKCSGLTYQVPLNASTRGYWDVYDGSAAVGGAGQRSTRRVYHSPSSTIHQNKCRTYYLRQGCWSSKSCSGRTHVSVTSTSWKEPHILSLQQNEQLQANVKDALGVSLDAVRRTLYYSDVSEGGSGLLRCWLHVDVDDYDAKQARTASVVLPDTPSCTQLEVVTDTFEKVKAMSVVTSSCYAHDGTASVQVGTDASNGCDLVFFVDAHTSALWRLLLPALAPGNVYDYRANRRPQYVPVYDTESSLVLNMGTPVKIMTGLLTPVGFSLDSHNLLYASDGVVSIATAADAAAYSEAYADSGNVGRAFISLVEGKVIRVDTTLLLTAAAFLPMDVQDPLLTRAYGLHTVIEAPSRARLGGLAVVPIVPSPTNWTQHRCFIADANQQQVYAATEWPGGSPSLRNTLDLSVFGQNSVLFPVQVAVRPTNVSASTVELYIAEYLGKIWRVKVPRDPVGGGGVVDILKHEQGNPHGEPAQLLDASEFPASIRVRRFVDDATAGGSPVHEKLTFEGLQ
eukprot:GSChrysophyteH1.ASY1.ANO1.1685.1 assembled CDS